MSYCWGEPVFDHEIEFDGQPVQITESVFEMLSQLSQEGPQQYWIDQICINPERP